MEHFGAISLIPAALVITTAILSKRPIESLLVGVVSGLLLLSPGEFIPNFAELLLTIMMDETIAWVIIVCGLMGSLIVLLMRSGAVFQFSELVAGQATSRKSSLIATWMLGLVIFIDDYLNALAVSSSMKSITDRFKVSREMLAYVVDSTAAPICILIPISTWGVFFAGVLESTDVAPPGEGMSLYISAIPYMLYAWIAAILVPLVCIGRIPIFGPMAAAEARAQAGEAVIIETEGMDHQIDGSAEGDKSTEPGRGGIWNFIVPVVSMLFFSWYYNIDVLIGIVIALGITIPLFGIQGLMPWGAMFDGVLDGIKIMVPALTIVVVAFMFKDVNDQLGLPAYVIETVKPLMSARLLPAITFITMAFVAFATGSSWGIFAIAIPIVVPLGQALNVPTPLVLGALLSASSFGSHACFYSDSTVLAAQGSGCGVMDHALTQFPYVLIAAGLAVAGLTILAW